MAEGLGVAPVVLELVEVREERPYDVVLFNDPVTPAAVVTRILMQVFSYSKEKAHRYMTIAHTQGKAAVWSGEKGKAVDYCTQLNSNGLWADVEEG